MPEKSQPIKRPHPATVGLIFLAVAFVTIILLSLYYYFFNKIRTQTRLEQRVAKRERDFDGGTMDDEDLEIQVPPKASTRI